MERKMQKKEKEVTKYKRSTERTTFPWAAWTTPKVLRTVSSGARLSTCSAVKSLNRTNHCSNLTRAEKRKSTACLDVKFSPVGLQYHSVRRFSLHLTQPEKSASQRLRVTSSLLWPLALRYPLNAATIHLQSKCIRVWFWIKQKLAPGRELRAQRSCHSKLRYWTVCSFPNKVEFFI
jgi:hypothetical protein